MNWGKMLEKLTEEEGDKIEANDQEEQSTKADKKVMGKRKQRTAE